MSLKVEGLRILRTAQDDMRGGRALESLSVAAMRRKPHERDAAERHVPYQKESLG
jgi:hypothetical protein